MNCHHTDRGRDALLKLIKSCSITAEGRKHIQNWSLHMKNANYGKRTGKQVSITNDISKLFPSSPSTSNEDSPQKGMSSDKAADVSASDQTASGKVFDKTANMSKRLSGINTKVLPLSVDKTNHHSIVLNGTDNGSFTYASTSSPTASYHSATAANKTQPKSIKRRLTFSEKKLLKSKEAAQSAYAEKKKTSSNEKLEKLENSFISNSTIMKLKNSSVVTVNSDVTRFPDVTATVEDAIAAEINAVDNQFAIEKETASPKNTSKKKAVAQLEESFKELHKLRSSKSNPGTRTVTPELRASEGKAESRTTVRPKTKDSVKKPVRVEENANDSEALSDIENISPSKKRRSSRVLRDDGDDLHSYHHRRSNSRRVSVGDHDGKDDSDSSRTQTKTLRQWLRNEMPNKSPLQDSHRLRSSNVVHTLRSRKEKDDVVIVDQEEASLENGENDDYAETSPAYVCEEAAADDGVAADDEATADDDKSRVSSRKQSISKTDEQPSHKIQETESETAAIKKNSKPKRAAVEEKSQPEEIAVKEKSASKKIKPKTTKRQRTANKKRDRRSFRFANNLPPPKLVVPEPSPEAVERGLRRSKRARVRPLQSWYGEKLIYGDYNELLGLQTSDDFQPVKSDLEIEDWMLPKRSRQNKHTAGKKSSKNRSEKLEENEASNVEIKGKRNRRKKKIIEEEKSEVPNVTVASDGENDSKNRMKKSEDNDASDVEITRGKTNRRKKKVIEDEESEVPHVEKTTNDTIVPNESDPAVEECVSQWEINATGNVSSSIIIKRNGESVAVDATQLISVPENECAFGQRGQPWRENDVIRFTKGISNAQLSMGTINLGPGEEKGISKMKTDTLCFFVVSGPVEISIEDSAKLLLTKSYFYVPPQNMYNIRNVSKQKDAFLAFTQIKDRKPKI